MYVPMDASISIMLLSVVAVSAFSIALSQFMIEFTKKWAMLLISTWLGIILVLTIFKLLKIQSASISLIGALVGIYFGYNLCMQYSHVIPVFSASLSGAYLILKGVDIHFGNYPSEGKVLDSKKEIAIFGLYLFGLIFFTVSGTYLQLYGCKKPVKAKGAEGGEEDFKEGGEDDFKEMK